MADKLKFVRITVGMLHPSTIAGLPRAICRNELIELAEKTAEALVTLGLAEFPSADEVTAAKEEAAWAEKMLAEGRAKVEAERAAQEAKLAAESPQARAEARKKVREASDA